MPDLQSVTKVGAIKHVSPSCVVRTQAFLRYVVLGQSPTQSRQQRILGMMAGVVPSVQGVKRFGIVYINKSSGRPV